jgi:cation-transporting ATPase I
MFLVNSATLLSMGNGARVAYDLASSPLPAPRDPTPWHALDPDGVLARLESTRVGLDASLAARRARQLRGGPIAAGVQGTVELGRAILDEVLNPLVPLLAAGAGMSAFVGSLVDAGMVVGVVGLNAVLGGVQRFSTERAVRGLSRREQRRAVVLRVGERLAVGADDLVRGDVIILEAGDVGPADCRILEAVALEVDASSLTGESLPVNKRAEASFAREVGERSSMLHEGTVIAAGHARAVIVAVGQETEARRGEVQGQGVRPRTGVEARLAELMSLTAPVAAAAGLGLVVAGVARGHRLDKIIGSAVSLAVASVPEGLPLLATAAQLASASRLSRRGALVKHPRSIEALGRVDVLCFDKTGTVTQGRLALGRVSDGRTDEALDGVRGARRRALEVALRASPEGVLDASQPDAVDEALVRGALQLGLRGARPARRGELSFEARRGFHAVLSEVEGVATLSVKGAPEVVLPRCDRWAEGPLDDAARAHLAAEIERFASRGRRVLAVAERPYPADGALDDEAVSGLYFSGFLIFSDPVRPSARSAVAALKRAGIDVVLITGDHPSTAEAIAADLDLRTGGSLTGSELDELTDEQLEGRLAGVRVFARVTPAQKVRVVQSLQRAGRVVAMAGDGANDAPAIRLADVGIAMGERSTAAARGAADVILANERIETLVDAVLEGRTMWSSVRDAVSVLIGGNLGEIGYTVGVGLVDEVTPLNARQLLLVNLLTDVAPAMAIALRPPPERVSSALLHEGPEAALGRGLYRDIALRAATTTAGAAAAWTAGRLTGSVDRARTMGMVGLVGTQLGQTLTSGEVTTPVAVAGLGSAALLFVVVQTPGLSQFFGCTPLGPGAWATALGASTLATAAMSALSEGSLSLPWRYATRLDAASQGPRPVLDE